MRYLPHTPDEVAAMLSAVGAGTIDGLFAHIPEVCRRSGPPNLPESLSEWELDRHMDGLAGTTAIQPEYMVFMGAGSYDHHIPEAINHRVLWGRISLVARGRVSGYPDHLEDRAWVCLPVAINTCAACPAGSLGKQEIWMAIGGLF